MAEVIRDLTGSRARIEHAPLPVDDPKVRQPDITIARAKLGWEPSTTIEAGLAATLEDFKRRVA